MYIEDTIAGIIRAAADSGEIPGLTGTEVYTDMNGTNEWEGRSKFYVIRDRTDLLGDLAQEYNYSGTAQSQLTIAALGADKAGADPIIRGAVRALRRHLNDPPEPLDIYTLGDGDEVTIDPADVFAVDWEEAALDIAEIDEGDSVTIDEADTAVFGFLKADGTVDGTGWIILSRWTGHVSSALIYDPLVRQIFDWKLTAASGVERFDTGAWREQYFSTKTLDVLHCVESE